MRTHTGEKPYICTVEGCRRAFKAYGQLKDHNNKHINHKQFVCTICNSKFSRKSTLKLHILIHTGEKPHKCPYEDCGKAFTERSNMKKHFRIHERNTSITKNCNIQRIKYIKINLPNSITEEKHSSSLQISSISESFCSSNPSGNSDVNNFQMINSEYQYLNEYLIEQKLSEYYFQNL
jgi:uncharacterized Zn-finger protein